MRASALEVDEKVADHIVAEVEDNTLHLKLGRFTNVININGKLVMKAYITVRSLNSIRGKGDVQIHCGRNGSGRHPDQAGRRQLFARIHFGQDPGAGFVGRFANDPR